MYESKNWSHDALRKLMCAPLHKPPWHFVVVYRFLTSEVSEVVRKICHAIDEEMRNIHRQGTYGKRDDTVCAVL